MSEILPCPKCFVLDSPITLSETRIGPLKIEESSNKNEIHVFFKEAGFALVYSIINNFKNSSDLIFKKIMRA